MIVAVVKEIKNNEFRVALTPPGVLGLVKAGHQVKVQAGAGQASGLSDVLYIEAGAEILPDAKSCFAIADMIVKVKEPLPEEYDLIREGQIVFTYFHFAASKKLTMAMIERKAVCVAYETVEDNFGGLPLLAPMSAVAGRCAIQTGANLLEKVAGGKGILMGGVPGTRRANVLILGGGNVGFNSAKMAAGLGANVYVLDINLDLLAQLENELPSNVQTLYSSEWNIRKLLPTADLVIGAVLIPGGKAPKLITKDMLDLMEPGSVLIDVAVDQGGCIETARVTTHACPTFEVSNIIHYGVANIPGNVPGTSTVALTNATMPYVIKLANKGWKSAMKDVGLKHGFNMVNGVITYQEVAETFDLPHTPLEDLKEW